MPRLSLPEKQTAKVEFVLSVPIDLMNAMYFTHLVAESEGIDGWPAQVRNEMAPELLAELVGALHDSMWAHRETWRDIESLLTYVRGLPTDVGNLPENPGIQGLVFHTWCTPFQISNRDFGPIDRPRERLIEELHESEGTDVESALAVFDDPERLRRRIVELIERFYTTHYRPDESRRLGLLARSVEAHSSQPVTDLGELSKKLSGRPNSCLAGACDGPFEKIYFSPSVDMGPYISCSNIGSIHGMFYPLEAEFEQESAEQTADTRRLARIYKALGDEQRLRILHILHDKEMYAQEIVERTGLHQSAVSRHLSFMAAVGLLMARREGNMKFFSINPEMRDTLTQTTDLFKAPMPEPVD
jgi:DNA-binding transcriptional ArsR family regulator